MKYDALGQLEQSLLLAIAHRGEGYCGDEHRVRHTVVNLLTNAIKWGASDAACTVPVLYLILRFLVDLASSGGSDRA
jgi:hypothetical protein